MFRRVIAGLFLGPALLIGSFAWSGYIALRTVFDSSRSATIAQELFDNDEVRTQLAENVAAAVEAALPDEVPVSRPQVAAAAEKILADPQVENLVIGAFSSTHLAFLGEGDAPRTLDLTPVATMVREQLASAAPSLAEKIPADQPLIVTLPTDQIPDASPVHDFLAKAVPFLAAISLVGVLIALLATSDRPSVLKRAAGWAIGTTAVYLIIGLGVPELLRRFAPDQAKVIAALLTALLRSTLTPSIILAIVGGVLLVVAYAWPDGSGKGQAVPAAVQAPPPAQPAMSAAPRPQAQTWPAMPPAPQPAAVPRPAPAPSPAPLPPPAPAPAPVPPVAPAPAPAPPPPPAAPPEPTVLPTRATTSEPVDLPAWTGEPPPTKWLPPKWVEGHGWVLDPDDPRPPPANSRWVEGIGHVVPGPPPGE